MYPFFVWLRNLLYDEHLLPSRTVKTPTICVGNLAVGGTGKTPHVEYLIRLLSDHGFRVAVVSRGYRRKTSGFILADEHATADTIGDEPMQIHLRFPDVPVAVCANRIYAIRQLERRVKGLQAIILDDAYQYRKLRCGFNILLTAADRLYTEDRFLPFGRLRDSPTQALRANAVIVTRCPDDMSAIERRVISNRLHLPQFQYLYFSHVEYDPEVSGRIRGRRVLLVTGIAHPEPLLHYVRSLAASVTHLAFPDHHRFSSRDLARIRKCAEQLAASMVPGSFPAGDSALSESSEQDEVLILTTDKDYVRLSAHPDASDLLDSVIPLPIRVTLDTDASHFDHAVLRYVSESIVPPPHLR